LSCKTETQSTAFKTVTQDYFNDKNILNPLDATQSGQSQFDDQLQMDMTDGYRLKQTEFYNKYEKLLSTFNPKKLTAEEQNSYEILKWEVMIGKEMLKQPTNLLPLHQFSGVHLTMAQFAGGTSAQPFKTENDYAKFLKRMELYVVWLDSAQVYLKKGMQKGVVLPKALTEKVIPQFAEMPTEKVEDNQFYAAVKRMPTSISKEKQHQIAAQYALVIQTKLVPQYQKMAAFLQSTYLPASRTSSGIGSFAFGKTLYQSLAKQWTTTTLTPDEIHQLGLKEVARLNAEMEKVKNQVGFKGTLIAF